MPRKDKRQIPTYLRRSGKAVKAHPRTVNVSDRGTYGGHGPPAPSTDSLEGASNNPSEKVWWTRPHVVGMDARGVDLRGMQITANLIVESSFERALLCDAQIGFTVPVVNGRPVVFHEQYTSISNTTFRGANLRGIKFVNCEFSSVDFEKADLTGGRFEGCDVNGVEGIDLYGVVMGGETFDSLLNNTTFFSNLQFRYRQFGVEEACEALGISQDEFAVLVWAGDLEVRDGDLRRVHGAFNKDIHHVPEWVINTHRRHAIK
jgi:hypothetical protein